MLANGLFKAGWWSDGGVLTELFLDMGSDELSDEDFLLKDLFRILVTASAHPECNFWACLNNKSRRENSRSHTPHTKGFSWVWDRSWRFKCSCLAKALVQVLHTYNRGFPDGVVPFRVKTWGTGFFSSSSSGIGGLEAGVISCAWWDWRFMEDTLVINMFFLYKA